MQQQVQAPERSPAAPLAEDGLTLRRIADAGPMLIWVADQDGSLAYFNERWHSFTGQPPVERLGDAWREAVHPDDVERCLAVYRAAFDAREEFEMEYRLRRHDAMYRWVFDRGRPYFSADGAFAGYLGSCIDITDWRQSQTALSASQERLRRAREAAHLGMFDWNVETDEVVWDGVEEIHGVPAGAFEGTFDAFAKDIHPDDRERVLGDIARAVESQGELHLQYRIIRPDGEVRWVSGDGRTYQDPRGRTVRVTGTCMDITDRKQSEEAMRLVAQASAVLGASLDYEDTLARLTSLFVPAIADWCVVDVVEEDGDLRRLTIANQDPQRAQAAWNALQQYGLTPGRIGVADVIRTRQPLLVSDITDDMIRAVARDADALAALRRAKLRSFVCVPLVARGRTIGAISLLTMESGRRLDTSQLALSGDLASRVALAIDNARLFQEAQESAEALREANRAKDEFLGLVSHELRTPITTILGNAQVLRRRFEQLNEDSRRTAIEDIEEETERLNRIVENLLVLARIDAASELQTEPVLAQRVVEEVLHDHRLRHPARALKLTTEGESEPVAAEPVYLEQVVRNLLTNAEKYSPRGAPIEVKITTSKAAVRVSVLDEGIGIQPGDEQRIFAPFYRAARTSHVASGAGMGLAVCKRLIEAQGGKIWAVARPDQGTEVAFDLPLAGEVLS